MFRIAPRPLTLLPAPVSAPRMVHVTDLPGSVGDEVTRVRRKPKTPTGANAA